MKTDTVLLPAFWASALINNDYSGLDRLELSELQAWSHDNQHLSAALSYDIDPVCIRFNGMLTDCLAFDFHVKE